MLSSADELWSKPRHSVKPTSINMDFTSSLRQVDIQNGAMFGIG